MWNRQMCYNQGRAGAGRVEVSTSKCKKIIVSRMKPTDKESESIESTSTSETLSMQCRRHLSGTWWTCFIYQTFTYWSRFTTEQQFVFLPNFGRERNRCLPVLGSPHRMVAEWVGGSAKIWVQAHKNAWHVPWSTANSLYTFPIAEGDNECPLPSGMLTQVLLQHVDQCMRHEDVVKRIC